MSLIPWNNNDITTTNNNNTLDYWSPFPQHIWDQFFNFPTFPFTGRTRTVLHSELGMETSGGLRAKVECRKVEEAHLVVAELAGVEKHEVDVTTEDGGVLSITGSGGEGDRRFSWRMKMPEGANVGMLSWSMENGVLTVVVPKVGVHYAMEGWGLGKSRRTNRRQIEIKGFYQLKTRHNRNVEIEPLNHQLTNSFISFSSILNNTRNISRRRLHNS